jgi:hypothetical protein
LFGKSLIARHFSWLAFVASQVIIDLETLYYLLARAYPLHRFFHTFLGATLAGAATGFVMIGPKVLIEKNSPWFRAWIAGLPPSLRTEFTNAGVLLGALIGGVSHPVLDGIMHRDIHPFAPWTGENPLLQIIGVGTLHLACLLFGLLGLAVVVLRLYREGLTNKSQTPTPHKGGAA